MTSSLLAGVSLAALTSTAAGTPFLLRWLADGDVLFTTVREGTVKTVMKGNSFEHMVMSLRGYHLNMPGDRWYDRNLPKWEIVRNPANEECDSRSYITRKLGIYLVGVPYLRKVYSYHFEWNEMRLLDGQPEMWSRKEETDFIQVTSFPYVMKLTNAKTMDNLPVNVEYQITMRINNPYKALFDTENWMEVVTGIINGAVRNFVGCKTFDELRSETDQRDDRDRSDDDSFTLDAKRLNRRLDGEPEPNGENRWELGLMGKYGVTIEKLDIQRVDLDEKYVASTQKIYNAEQDARAVLIAAKARARAAILDATAEALRTRRIGKAQAESIKDRAKALNGAGDIATVMARTEALMAAASGPNNANFLWGNSPL